MIDRLRYSAAVGARAVPSVPGAISFGGPAVARAVGESAKLALVMPTASGWSLPVYELAIMTAAELRNRGAEPDITVVTPEREPLRVFGAGAGAAISRMLAERGIALRAGTRALAFRDGALDGDFGQALRALDAGAALGDGALPDAWAKRREVWRAAHRHAVA